MGLGNLFKRSKPKKETKVVVVELNKVKNFKYLDDLIRSGKKEIELDADIVLEDSEKSKFLDGIRIDDDIILNGNGHTIDACGKVRIFHVVEEKFTIKNLTLKNGFSNKYGGAMSCFGDGIVIENCIFDHNIAKHKNGTGGAIYANCRKMTIKSSIFKNNLIIGDFGNGAAIYNGANSTISDSKFLNNIIAGVVGSGGAIYSTKKMRVTDCEFAYNIAISSYGAIKSFDNGTVVENCKFARNMARRHQHFDSANIAVINCEYDHTEYDPDYVDVAIAMALMQNT